MQPFRAGSADDILREVRARELSHIALGCVDWDGRVRAKHYSTTLLADALAHGLSMTTTLFAQDPADQPILFGPFEDEASGYPDGCLRLDPTSARESPFDAAGRGLLVLGQFVDRYAGYCPRALLDRELGRYAALGYRVCGAFELEFRLLDENSRSLAGKSAEQLCLAPGFERMYGLVDQAAAAPFRQVLLELCERMRLPLATLHHEFKGLIEAAMAVDEGLAIADAATLFRNIAAIAARGDGRLACFMAMVSPRTQSAGAHLNLSLRAGEDGRNAFYDAAASGGMSAQMRAFIGGLQAYVPELFVLLAPTINSYKRFAPLCIAPRSNSWGMDNKTVAYRVVTADAGHARIEIRVPGADVNPHLAMAAVLAAGRAGLEQGREPTARCEGDGGHPAAPSAAPFPTDLRTACARWRASTLAAAAFGVDFVDAYARSREWQQHQFDSAVTDWELQAYARMV